MSGCLRRAQSNLAIPMPGKRFRFQADLSAVSCSAIRQGGFSLIELLVAVLVMGVGILGVGALQLLSLQDNRAALSRVEAVNLAWDMLDRIRANPEARLSYGDITFDSTLPQADDCGLVSCTPAEIAAFDARSWKCQFGRKQDLGICAEWRERVGFPSVDLLSGLPGGDGAVAIRGEAVQVTVRWVDQSGQNLSVLVTGRF